jgi:hypothetical protein
MKPRRAALALVAGGVLFGLLFAGVSQASSGTTTVTSPPTGGGTSPKLVDLKSVSHADDSTNITWSFHTANVVTPSSFDHVQWDLDLNKDGSATGQEDACVFMVSAGSVLRAALQPHGCGPTTANTSDAKITPSGGGDDVSVSFKLSDIKAATGFSGTSYQYRVTLVDANGWTYIVPSSTTFITHTLGGSSSTPTPTPTARASATPTPTPAGQTPTPSPTATVVGTTTNDPTASPSSATLPRTGVNISYLLMGAAALLYVGIELLGAKRRLEDQKHD